MKRIIIELPLLEVLFRIEVAVNNLINECAHPQITICFDGIVDKFELYKYSDLLNISARNCVDNAI